MILQEFIHKSGMTQEEWDRRRAVIDANKNKFYREYELAHARCPRCRSSSLSRTLVGYMLAIDENLDVANKEAFKNENDARCSMCGWAGIVHDLVGVDA